MRHIVYQVLPRIWGSGKLAEWDTPVFDYLKSLGINTIWYTGIIRHASGQPFVKGNPGSPYAISDYFDVNPYLATNEAKRIAEFEALVKRTHNAGLKVIIDFVPNHVACDNTQIPVHPWCDYDWTDTKKVDYGHPDTYGKMLEILRYWASKGVDGFRCDMVEMVPVHFFEWVIPELKKEFPELLFIGEAYNRANYRPLLDAGFDLLYDKSGVYDILRHVICDGWGARELTGNWQFLQDMQPHMLNFLENHDEQRIASPYFAGKASKAYSAFAFCSLFNTASVMLYAGQELGEAAAEGAEGRTSIFDWTAPVSLKHLHAMVHSRKPLPAKEKAVLEHYRQILTVASTPLASEGANYDLCWCNEGPEGFDPERHFAFLRYDANRCILVFCNFSDNPAKAFIHIPEGVIEKCRPVQGGIEVSASAWDAALVELTSRESS